MHCTMCKGHLQLIGSAGSGSLASDANPIHDANVTLSPEVLSVVAASSFSFSVIIFHPQE